MKPRIIIIPGNGGSHIETDNWYAWVRDGLAEEGFVVTATDMPDPVDAHRDIWLPYIENVLKADGNTIVIGHSSGAVAALRYLEKHRLAGAILVGCNYTDLGDAGERAAGWYSDEWQWDKIKANAGWIVQFHSDTDPFIPLAEPQFIQKKLGSDLRVLPGRGHFMTDHNPVNNTFPEIIELLGSRFAKIG